MAGFSGMPLGSFSGRGADFQPFQFIIQLRQRQAEQEQARKEQAAAAQQSFLMAVMSQKQQQQALAQRQQEAMMQREMEQQNQARLADQFRSEQSRLQGAEQRRLEMEAERLKAAQDQDVAQAKAKESEAAQRRTLQTKGAEAMTWVETQAQHVLDTNMKNLGDPMAALDATEAWLKDAAARDPDAERRAATIANIVEWRNTKEKQILGRESFRSIADARESQNEERALRGKDRAEERERKARADKNKASLAKAKARAALIQGDGGLLDRAQEALYMAKPDERKAAQDRVDALTKELEDLYAQLAELE